MAIRNEDGMLVSPFVVAVDSREQAPYKEAIHLDWYIAGLRNAGLPE